MASIQTASWGVDMRWAVISAAGHALTRFEADRASARVSWCRTTCMSGVQKAPGAPDRRGALLPACSPSCLLPSSCSESPKSTCAVCFAGALELNTGPSALSQSCSSPELPGWPTGRVQIVRWPSSRAKLPDKLESLRGREPVDGLRSRITWIHVTSGCRRATIEWRSVSRAASARALQASGSLADRAASWPCSVVAIVAPPPWHVGHRERTWCPSSHPPPTHVDQALLAGTT